MSSLPVICSNGIYDSSKTLFPRKGEKAISANGEGQELLLLEAHAHITSACFITASSSRKHMPHALYNVFTQEPRSIDKNSVKNCFLILNHMRVNC